VISAVVVAGGAGQRFGSDVPKQFLLARGRPIVSYAVETIASVPGVQRIALVVPQGWLSHARDSVLPAADCHVDVRLAEGGPRRRDSVLIGLSELGDEGLVVVHDGVRPLASCSLTERVVEAARVSGAAVAALPVGETLKEVRNGGVVRTVEREGLWSIQTPQAFDIMLLREAHAKTPVDVDAPDDAALVELLGHKVSIVEGEAANIKVTRPEDLRFAEALLSERGVGRVRVGYGFDVHPFVENRELVLGGVKVPYAKGLGGHSDADVLAHAIADAALGAASLGDIGTHFPPSDPSFEGVSSMWILETVANLLRDRGYRVTAVDATVVAEEPVLSPHIPAMKQTIAPRVGLHARDVSVKATTTEGLGFTGRQEGIAAMAIATVERTPHRAVGPRC
jgi:2-C-methyl-D-erythritol 4-phosphate cytidylyltransferase/2-C-methyl-D-erythritol 2,4-cyclodiphosphate synthase